MKYKYIYLCECNAGYCQYDSHREFVEDKSVKFCGRNRKVSKKRIKKEAR